MVLGGVGLLVAGAAYRYLQLHAAEAQIDKGVALLEQAAEFRRIAADKAADQQNEAAKAQAADLQKAADMRERFANLMLEVRPQPVSDAHMESSGEATDPVEQIANAKKLLESGAIDQTEFEKLKQKAIG